MQYQINIPDPCGEDWNGMTPDANGRHCALCCKTVIDFTDLSTEEIAAYLYTQQHQSVCGRFKQSQLADDYISPDTYIYQLQHSGLSFVKKIAALMLFVFCLSATVHAQTRKTTPKSRNEIMVGEPAVHVLQGKVAAPQQPPKPHDPVIMGMMPVPRKADTTQKLPEHKTTAPAGKRHDAPPPGRIVQVPDQTGKVKKTEPHHKGIAPSKK